MASIRYTRDDDYTASDSAVAGYVSSETFSYTENFTSGTVTAPVFFDAFVFDGTFGSFASFVYGDPDLIYILQHTDGIRADFSDVGSSTLGGGSRADQLIGGAGDDFLSGNDGDDILTGNAGNDDMNGGFGDDVLYAGDGADTLRGDDGDDRFHLTGDAILVDGGDGFDTIVVTADQSLVLNETTAVFGIERFEITTGALDLSAIFDGFDIVVDRSSGGSVRVTGSQGADRFVIVGGELGDARIDGGDGRDVLDLSALATAQTIDLSTATTIIGIENVVGGSADDFLTGDAGNNTLVGGAGDDRLSGGDGDDVLAGGTGANTLNGGAGSDTISFAGLASGITFTLAAASSAADQAMNDIELSPQPVGDGSGSTYASIENVTGTAFDDVLTGNSDGNVINGGDGNDTLTGGGARLTNLDDESAFPVDVLNGGAGDDTLRGRADDEPDGYMSLVALYGEDGDDTFESLTSFSTVINGGDGFDTIVVDNGLTLFGSTAVFGMERILLTGGSLDLSSLNEAIADRIVIAPLADASVTAIGSQDGDTFVVTDDDARYTIDGQGGYDVLDLTALTTDQTVDIGATNLEEIRGGSGNDTLSAGGEGVTLSGGDGADVLTGGAGDDLLDAGQGADVLSGGDGGDTFVISSSTASVDGGDGDDAILVLFDRLVVGADTVVREVERIVVVEGALDLSARTTAIAPIEVVIGGKGRSSIVGSQGDDVVVVSLGGLIGVPQDDEWTEGDEWGGLPAVADESGGGDEWPGEEPPREPVRSPLIDGQDGFDTLDLSMVDGDVTIDLSTDGTIVNVEALIGGSGDDMFTGDAKDNALTGAEGDDVLVGGDGNDVLNGGNGADQLVGGVGQDFASYADAAEGVTVNTARPATSRGEAVGDTYDSIEGLIGSDFADRVTLDATLQSAQLGDGNDAIIVTRGFTAVDGGAGIDTLTIFGNIAIAAGSLNDVERINVANVDGAGVDLRGFDRGLSGLRSLSAGTNRVTIHGSDFGDTIVGGSGADRLFGEGGNDRILVSGTTTRIDGGAGQDLLSVRLASGTQVSYDATTLVGIEQIDLANGVSLDATGVGDGLLIAAKSGTGTATITGTNFTDRIVGAAGAETIDGGGGNDNLDGGAGDDRLTGGMGGDILTGGRGADTFHFSSLAEMSGLNAVGATVTDRILDFSHTAGDRIDLSQLMGTGDNADRGFSFRGTPAFSGAGDAEVRVQATSVADRFLVQFDGDGDGSLDAFFVVVGQQPVSNDFIMV